MNLRRRIRVAYFILVIYSCGDLALSDMEGWYQIQVLGCLLPIPNEMVLKTEGSPYFFYSDLNIEHKKILQILIEEYREPSLSKYKYSNLKSSDWLDLYSTKYKEEIVTYTITNKIKSVHVTKDIGESRINFMYDQCLENKLPKNTITDEEFNSLKNANDGF